MLSEIIEWLQKIYSTNTDVLVLELLNTAISVYLVYMMLRIAMKAQKGSLAITMRLLAYAFVVFLAHEIISIVSRIPSIRWNLLYVFTETVFLCVVIYTLNQVKTSVEAYEYVLKKKIEK